MYKRYLKIYAIVIFLLLLIGWMKELTKMDLDCVEQLILVFTFFLFEKIALKFKLFAPTTETR